MSVMAMAMAWHESSANEYFRLDLENNIFTPTCSEMKKKLSKNEMKRASEQYLLHFTKESYFHIFF